MKFKILFLSLVTLANHCLHAGIEDYFQYSLEQLVIPYSKGYNIVFDAPTKQDLFDVSRFDTCSKTNKDVYNDCFKYKPGWYRHPVTYPLSPTYTEPQDITVSIGGIACSAIIKNGNTLETLYQGKNSEYKLPFKPVLNSVPHITIANDTVCVHILRDAKITKQNHILHKSRFTLPEDNVAQIPLTKKYYMQSMKCGLRNTAAAITVGALGAHSYHAGYFKEVGCFTMGALSAYACHARYFQ